MNYQYNNLALVFDITAIAVSVIGSISAIVFIYFESRKVLKYISAHISLSMILYAFIQCQWVFGGQLYGDLGSFYEIMWALSAIMFTVDLFVLVWLLRRKR